MTVTQAIAKDIFGKNKTDHRFDSHIARILARATTEPHGLMMSDRERTLSNGQFAELVYRVARVLIDHDIDAANRIALVAPTTIEALAVRYAAGLLGATSVFCPSTGSPERLAEFVIQVGADSLVVFPETADQAWLSIRSPQVRRAMGWGPVSGTEVDLAAAAASSGSTQIVPSGARPDAIAALTSSGGTTGLSKASRRTFARWSDMISGPHDPARRQLICTPFAYIGQLLADQTLVAGGTVVLREHFDAADALETIEAERISHLCLVEPWLVELADHPDVTTRDLSSLVAVSHIGAAAAPSLRRRLLRRLGPVLAHPYGASEAGLISVLAAPEYSDSHPELLDSVGRALPGVEVFVEDADGTAASPGMPGRIAVRSRAVADGYVLDPGDTGFHEDKYYTGDVATSDAAGYLRIRGRAKDARTIEGHTVFPVDVQDALCSHADVRYAVAVPVESGFVAVVQSDAATPAGLRDWVRACFGAHEVPEAIRIVDRVPVTEQGKPDRAAITALFGR
jgi:acyl-CoA synthetase (AMP-forming)/AMP-acid ligase II